MTTTETGRWTAEVPDDGIVVFHIGMRINRLRRLRSTLQVARAMPSMLRVLEQDPELGLLGWHQYRSGRTILLVQYWRSASHLERFATDSTLPHAGAWRDYNRAIAASGDVGIFHETYRVAAVDTETFYGNVPPLGLAAAVGRVPIRSHAERFAQRIAV